MAESKLQREAPEPKAPMYMQSALYAISHDETDAYRASHLANVDCRKAIENAIAEHYHDNRLDFSFARDILETYGMERTQTVLASTIRAIDWDGRISVKNKNWAKSFSLPDASGQEYHINRCNPGLTDLFCNEVRRIQREQERKPSVLEKLRQHLPERTAATKKSIEIER